MDSKVKMKTPEGMTSVSCGGEEYKVEKGVVEVDAKYVDHLCQHGLTVVPGVPEVAPKK